MVEIAFQSSPRDFLNKCGAVLEKDEVEHNLMLSLCQAAEKKQKKGEKADIRCSIVSDGDDFVLAAVQTPPHNIILSKSSQPDVERLAEELAKKKFKFPGIVGPSDVTSIFSNKWAELTGQKSVEYMDQIIYVLKNVVMPTPVEGEMRLAKPDEVDLVAEWNFAFSAAAAPKSEQISEKEARAQAEDIVKAERVVFWCVKGKPVAQASFSGTDSVARISRVYTPPENRGKGYASAVVAHLSKMQLDLGKKLCCLYADARNPVSNSIYRKIGYEFAGRSSLYVLDKN